MSGYAWPLGAPGWRIWAKLGLPLTIKVEIARDDEAQVFVASSKNLHGLHVEGETLDEVSKEVRSAILDLLHDNYPLAEKSGNQRTTLEIRTPLAA